jgi:hypothetical protein
LHSRQKAGYRVGRLAVGPWSTVTTGQVGHFTLTCLDRGGFVRDAPMIAAARPAAAERERADLDQPLPNPTEEL